MEKLDFKQVLIDTAREKRQACKIANTSKGATSTNIPDSSFISAEMQLDMDTSIKENAPKNNKYVECNEEIINFFYKPLKELIIFCSGAVEKVDVTVQIWRLSDAFYNNHGVGIQFVSNLNNYSWFDLIWVAKTSETQPRILVIQNFNYNLLTNKTKAGLIDLITFYSNTGRQLVFICENNTATREFFSGHGANESLKIDYKEGKNVA